MFRLNGDIIKQLENIYNIKFYTKYKIELKDRIISFLHSKVKEHLEENLFETLHKISSLVIIEHNRPTFITEYFFYLYKKDLFNSFNPLWYKEDIKKEKHLTKSDIDKLVNNFINSSCNELEYLKAYNLNPYSFYGRHKNFEINFIYSEKIYKKIYLDLNKQYLFSLEQFNNVVSNILNSEERFHKIDDNSFIIFKENIMKYNFSSDYFSKFLSDFGIYIYQQPVLSQLRARFLRVFFLYEIMIKAKNKAGIS